MRTTQKWDGGAGSRAVFTWFALAALLAVLLPLAPRLSAQDAGQPVRAVRLSYVDGKVTISQDNQVVTDQAVANTPLLEGMTLTTAGDGRAEVQFEDGSIARISPDSSLTLKVLRGQGASIDTELDLNKGLGYFELQNNGQSGTMRVKFGDSVVTGSGFTILRVKDDNPPGQLAVFSGNAHLERNSGLALDLHGGESVDLSATDPNGYNLAESIEPDSWDAWNSDRDSALNAETSTQTGAAAAVSGGQSNNPAWGDLDANGSWYNVPDQGYVWSPYEAASAGFDPYGNGNWVFTPGFGYTWASAYPWGYLPFQCGAWNYYDGFGWGWAPGLGGCSPWWYSGFYGGPYIGFAPGWYHPIHRPIGPPIHPGHPMPVIAINRRPMVLSAGLPARDRNNAVTINGRAVAPLRTIPVRSAYARSTFAARNGYTPTAPADRGRSGYVPSRSTYTPAPQRPVPNNMQRGFAPQRTYQPANRGASQPAPRTYSPPPSYSGGYHGGGAGGGASHSGGHH